MSKRKMSKAATIPVAKRVKIMCQGYIYQIVNTVTGLAYVGRTTNMKRRMMQHFRTRDGSITKELHQAIHEFGSKAFVYDVVELVKAADLASLQVKLCEREAHWICIKDTVENGMNMRNENGGDSRDVVKWASILEARRKYPCPKCPWRCCSDFGLREHDYWKHDGPRPYVCDWVGTRTTAGNEDVCGKSFQRKHELKNHRRIHTGESPYTCKHDDCSMTFKEAGTASTHYRQVHGTEKPHVCGVCHMAFARSDGLTQHAAVHNPAAKTKACPHCNFVTKWQGSLDEHVKAQHTEKDRFKCNDCCKTFGYNNVLTEHRRIHTGEKPYTCDQCEYRGAQHSSLQRHKARHHSGLKPHKCNYESCDYAGATREDLRQHKLTHMDSKPYLCSHCNKGFTKIQMRDRHELAVHSGTKPHVCPVEGCEFACADPSSLNVHQRKHTEERLFACRNCKQRFRHSQSRNKHENLNWCNRGAYPFQCDQCRKRFARETDKEVHNCDNTPRHTCEGCGKTYTSYQGLWRHKKQFCRGTTAK